MARPTYRRLLSLTVALALTLAVLGLGALSFQRKLETFQLIGFQAELHDGHWAVTQVESAGSPLQPGDQILLLNGSRPASQQELHQSISREGDSQIVLLRDEQLLEVSYARPQHLRIDIAYLILSAIALIYVLIGAYTLVKDRRRQSIHFYLWCLTSATLYLVSAPAVFDLVGKALYLLDEFARLLIGPLTLHLFWKFPRPLAQSRRSHQGLALFYVPAVFLLALQVDLMYFRGYWFFDGQMSASIIASLDRVELYHLVGFGLAAAAVLLGRLRNTKALENHRQVVWLTIGMVGGYVPFFLLYVLPQTLKLTWPGLMTHLAVLPLALVPLTFAYAILRYKLWDIGVMVRDTVTLSLTILVGVFGFSIFNLIISRTVPEDFGLTRSLLSFVTGLVIAGVMLPTHRGISTSLERFQYRHSYDKRRAMVELGNRLLLERDLDALAATLQTEIQEALEIERTALWIVAGEDLLPQSPPHGETARLPVNFLGEKSWRSEVETLRGIGLLEEDTPELELFTQGYRYAFPFAVRDRKLGMLFVGYKLDQTPLNADDLDLLRNALNQAALALENAMLLEEVQQQLSEVGRLQRENEQVIESSPAGIAAFDPLGQIVSANAVFADLTGSDRDRLLGRPIREVLPVASLPSPGDGLIEASVTNRAGEEKYLQLSVDSAKEPVGRQLSVLVVQDVTERVVLERELEEKERLASLGMLAAGVAHEVNTPITGISSYAQMLLDSTPEDDPRHELLRKVEKQTFRAAQIVRNLLEFARDRPYQHQPVSLSSVLNECVDLASDRAAESGIRIQWQPAEGLIVAGNESELQQVFSNLINNAIDAMAEDGGDLKLLLTKRSDRVRTVVEDTGSGISTTDLEKIFQPFYSTKLSAGGTGLGLSISYNIVRRHGGTIRVISQPGQGSRFLVELPAYRERPAEPAEPADGEPTKRS